MLILVNFNLEKTALAWLQKGFLGFFGIFNGPYSEFTNTFYSVIGTQFCMTMIFNIATPHAYKGFVQPIITFTKRCLDRGCHINTKRRPENKMNDEVWSEKHLQTELTELYSGPQIQSAYVYAQIFTTLLAVMTFSAGMPALYPIAAAFYIVYYIVYHCLFLRYYSKTATFNQDLPLYSLRYIYLALVLHLVFGLTMLTNEKFIPAVKADAFGNYAESLMEAYGLAENSKLSGVSYSMHSMIYCAFLLLCIGIPVLLFIVYQFLAGVVDLVLSMCSKYKSEDPDIGRSTNYYLELSFLNLKKLYTRAKNELQEFEEYGKKWIKDELDDNEI